MDRVITAIFQPAKGTAADVHPLAFPVIGNRLTWVTQGIIREGPYAGQQAWLPIGLDNFPGWVPDCDLVDRETIFT